MPPADRPVRMPPAQVGRKALGAEPHRDVGEHQAVADRDQRHRQDDAGNGDRPAWRARAAPRLVRGASGSRSLAFMRGRSCRRLRCRKDAPSGKSDIAERADAWTSGLSGVGQRALAPAAARMALDDSDERGPWMKVQAGAFMRASSGASPSSTRA